VDDARDLGVDEVSAHLVAGERDLLDLDLRQPDRHADRVATQGIGTGSAAEHWQALREGGARLYASGMSSKARGVSADEGVEMAPPDVLVRLIAEADRVVSY
jgi:hypothetical protein